eukprot:TRINITY_DN965_c0_g1_i2.p1 TRINITY_DN965_c0_g1~~TRINITY_DN965_c0_g1_i2.p1  ORF type:complete len:854 (-),score=304.47 TRINITY_DN965_c0_g1_i2:253-2814(-)
MTSPLSSPRLSPRSPSSPGGSPRYGDGNKGPSALRNELGAAKKAVEVLKQEKDHTQNKLEKLHAVLEKERAALRDVLQAARKAVDDLKVEKQEVEDNLTSEKKTTTEQAAEIERLKKLLRDSESNAGDSSSLNIQINTMNQQITELRNSNNSLTEQLNALRRENGDLQDQLRRASDTSSSDTELSALRKQIMDLQEQLRASQAAQANAQAAKAAPEPSASSSQLETLNKRLTTRLQSLQREGGIRWMNHILNRHRLHATVAAFNWWHRLAENKFALRELEDLKNEELKAQLAQAGRGLKKWMEEKEEAGADAAQARRALAIKMLAKVLSSWAAGTVHGCWISMKLNMTEALADTLSARRNADMVGRLASLRRQSAVLAMKEILNRWMHAELARGFYGIQKNFCADMETKRLFDLNEKLKSAGNATYWKEEAERTASLFDQRKAAFERSQKEAEYHRSDIQERLNKKTSELDRCRDELRVAVGDLAHQMNQSETDRATSERTQEINGQLEAIVRNHVVEGAVISGKLEKQGSVVSGNKKDRWCVLDARQLALYEDKKEKLAKTIIPLKDVESIEACPDWKKNAFAIKMKEGAPNQKTDVFRFDADNEGHLKLWLDNLIRLHNSNAALTEDWEQIRMNYINDLKMEQDKFTVLQANSTTFKVDAVAASEAALEAVEEKYDAMLKSQTKIDDDLWMWVERHMWQMTSAQGLGFGETKAAQALGGTGVPCSIKTEWTTGTGAAHKELQDNCFVASDGKANTYTVNFETPTNVNELTAVIKINNKEVVVAPACPVKDPKDEVKKLQRLMVLRNPSPPRSRSRGAGDHSASPRGKSPPKKRGASVAGSMSASPMPSPRP